MKKIILISCIKLIVVTNLLVAQRVGIGSTQFTPSNTLDVKGNMSIGTNYTGIATTAPADGLLIEGALGIGTTTTSEKLDIIGNIRLSGADPRLINNNSGSLNLQSFGATAASFRNNLATIFMTMDVTGGGGLLRPAFRIRPSATSTSIMEWQDVGSIALALVDLSGNFGIGTTTISSRLHIKSSGTSSAGFATKIDNSAGTGLLYVRNDGFVGIGTTNPQRPLHLTEITATNVPMARFEYTSGSSQIELHGNNASSEIIHFGVSGGSNVGKIEYYNPGGGGAGTNSMTFTTNSSERMRIDNVGNVGIGTTIPGSLLHVNGTAKIGRWYHNVASFSTSGVPTNGFKIKTNLPYTDMSQMPTIFIQGYYYRSQKPISLTLTYYIFAGSFTNPSVSSGGAYSPTITLANESGKVVIFLSRADEDGADGYYTHFDVHAYSNAMGAETDANYAGWTVADEAVTGTNVATATYKNSVGNLNIANGTTAGELKFYEPSGSGYNYSSFKAQAQAGNIVYTLPATDGSNGQVLSTNGSGTLSYTTALTPTTGWQTTGNASTVAGTNFIGTTDAIDFVVKTNNTEKMRVQSGGNVGIGTTSAGSKLHIDATEQLRLTSGANVTRWYEDGNAHIVRTNQSGTLWIGENGGYWSAIGLNDALSIYNNGAVDYSGGTNKNFDFYNGTKLRFFTGNGTGQNGIWDGATGNVGIGQITPAKALHILSTWDNHILLERDFSGTPGYGNLTIGGTVADPDLRFSAGLSTAQSSQIVLKSTGNVGIGTTTPGVPLEVKVNSANNGLRITSATTPGSYYTNFSQIDGYSTMRGVNSDININADYRMGISTGGGGWDNNFSFTTSAPIVGTSQGRFIEANATFAPSSGASAYRAYSLASTINQSGTATGNYTGLFLNITETSFLGTDGRLMDIQKNGVTQMIVKNNGNMGIGTSNPGTSLDIEGTGTQLFAIGGGGFAYEQLFLAKNANSRPVIGVGNAFSAAVPALTFGGGYEGLNGTSFEVRTDIMGAGAGGMNYANIGQALVVKRTSQDGTNATAISTVGLTKLYPLDANGIQLATSATATPSLTINATSGNVGIGLTNPSSLLHIYKGALGTDRNTIELGSGGWSTPVSVTTRLTDGTKIHLHSSSSNSNQIGMDANGNFWLRTGGTQLSNFDFYTGSDNTSLPTIKMRITNAGNVGIGTTSPNNGILQVNGGVSQTPSVFEEGGLIVTNGSTYTNPGVGALFVRNGATFATGSGNVGVGTSSPTSTLQVSGSFAAPITNKTAAYTVTASDHTIACDGSGGAFTITLPTAVGISGRIYIIKKTDASGNAITVDPNGTEIIDGSTTVNIVIQYERIIIQSDGANWLRID